MPKRKRSYKSRSVKASDFRALIKTLRPVDAQRQARKTAARNLQVNQQLARPAAELTRSVLEGAKLRKMKYRDVNGDIQYVYGFGGFWDDAWRGLKTVGRTALGALPKGTFSSIGGALGGLVGQGAAGAQLGSALSTATGYGSYELGPSVVDEGMNAPQIVNYAGGTVVSHREYLGPIRASDLFEITRYDVNPGDKKLFPWLSGIAGNFQQYRMRGMIVTFKSTSSDATITTNTNIGTVMMCTDYDVDDPAPFNKAAMMNYEQAVDNKPSSSFQHIVECDPAQSRNNGVYHIRTEDRSDLQADRRSLKDYDYASFYVATEGMQLSGGIRHPVGELWVSYEIELLKPQLLHSSSEARGSTIVFSRFNNVTHTQPFGLSAGEGFAEDPDDNPDGLTKSARLRYSEMHSTSTDGYLQGSNLGVNLYAKNSADEAYITFGQQVQSGVYMLQWVHRDTTAMTKNASTITLTSPNSDIEILEDVYANGAGVQAYPSTAVSCNESTFIAYFRVNRNRGREDTKLILTVPTTAITTTSYTVNPLDVNHLKIVAVSHRDEYNWL